MNKSLTMMFIAFLMLCYTTSLFCQDTTIVLNEDTLSISYYDEFDYVTNQYGDEFITHHDEDYEYFIDKYGAPIQRYCANGIYYCHYIYYGQVDHTVFEMWRNTETMISYTNISDDMKTITNLNWKCKKDQGFISLYTEEQPYVINKLYKGFQGRNHLIHQFFRILNK